MTEQSLQLSPQQGVDWAFHLPAETPDEYLALHADIVARLRNEAAGFPMNTIQTLLLERIAYTYVVIRMKEDGVLARFARANEAKDYNTFWMDMTKEFNKLLASGQDKLRETLLLRVKDVVDEAIKVVTDDHSRRELRRALSEGFASINL